MGATAKPPLDRVAERRRAVALARHYRDAEGLSIAKIAERLGRAPATIKSYFYDPTGEKAKGYNAKHRNRCARCGRLTAAKIRRTALALSQPRSFSCRQLRRDPMRAVRPLDPGIARLREPQRPPITGTRKVSGLAWLQPARLRPAAKRAHRRRDLPQVRDRHALQTIDAALAPLINPARLKPADADQHIDRGHELALRKRRLRRTNHPAIDVPAIAGHVERKLHAAPARERLRAAATNRLSPLLGAPGASATTGAAPPGGADVEPPQARLLGDLIRPHELLRSRRRSTSGRHR